MMQDRFFKKYNTMIGMIIGFILSQIVMGECYAFMATRQINSEVDHQDIIANYMIGVRIIAIIIFFASVVICNLPKIKKINLNKIGIYILLSIIASFIVTAEGIIILSRVLLMFFPKAIDYFTNDYFGAINSAFIVVIIAIALFLMTFTFLINRKVKYIKFLTKEVKVIKEEGFGKTIEVRGGDELAQLCRSINDMSIELGKKIENEKEIENNKNELITNISHDLKTPLTSIIGYLELLNNNSLSEKDREKYTKIAYSKSLRLKSLVIELFEYTKLTNNDFSFKTKSIDIGKILSQIVGESIIDFAEKNIDVVLDNKYEKLMCEADSQEIARVFENMVKNAEKYSDENSVFTVSVELKDKDIIISFINKCHAVKKEDLNKLFDKFYRIDKSRSKEGSGLGLPIAKKIVELHGGNLWAEKIDENIKFNIKLRSIA